jgi:hypothetical protein
MVLSYVNAIGLRDIPITHLLDTAYLLYDQWVREVAIRKSDSVENQASQLERLRPRSTRFGTAVHPTISKDKTKGEEAWNSDLLEEFGKRMRKRM